MFHSSGLCAGSECLEITQAQGQRERETEGILQPIYMKDEWGTGQAGWRSGGLTGTVISLVCMCVCCVCVSGL